MLFSLVATGHCSSAHAESEPRIAVVFLCFITTLAWLDGSVGVMLLDIFLRALVINGVFFAWRRIFTGLLVQNANCGFDLELRKSLFFIEAYRVVTQQRVVLERGKL